MSVRTEADAAGDIVNISGGMTMDNATVLLAQGVTALDAGRAAFDLAGVTEVDSSGLAVLFGWQRVAQAQGKSIAIVNPPHSLRSLADVYGVAELLPLS
jgi:phospholipid transport system transporter-binding protein